MSPRFPMLFQSRQPAPAETDGRTDRWGTAQLGFDQVPLGIRRVRDCNRVAERRRVKRS